MSQSKVKINFINGALSGHSGLSHLIWFQFERERCKNYLRQPCGHEAQSQTLYKFLECRRFFILKTELNVSSTENAASKWTQSTPLERQEKYIIFERISEVYLEMVWSALSYLRFCWRKINIFKYGGWNLFMRCRY